MAPVLVAPLFVLAAAAAPSAGAPPAAGAAVRISWEGPSGCADPGGFLAGVAARGGQVHRAEEGEDALRIEVHLARSAGKVHGALRIPGENGKVELREVEGSSCDEVADALSLTAALALGASGRPASVASATRSPGGPPAAAGSTQPPGVSPPAVAAPGSAGPATAPGLAGAVQERAPPAPPLVVAPVPAAPPASSEASSRDDSGTEPETRTLVPTIGLGAVAGQIVSPFVSLGGSVSARLAWRRGAPLDPSFGISFLHLRDDLFGASPEVTVRWTAVSVDACPGWGLGRASSASLEICVSGAGGWLSAAEQAVTVRRSAARSWWSAGASLRGRLALGWGGLAVEIDATAQVPLVHRRFVTSTPEETVGESPAVGLTLGVGVSRSL